MKRPLLLCSFLCLLVSLRAERDDFEPRSHRPETGRVVLYSGENFEGVAVELLPGAQVPDLRDVSFSDGRKVNDRISSVRVFGSIKVVLYSDPDFSGEALELDYDIARLNRVPRRPGANWDNCLSSLRISGGHPNRHRDDRDDRYDRRDRDDRDDCEWQPHRPRLSDAEVERVVVRAYHELLKREPTSAERRRYREAVENQDWGREEIYSEIRASREYRSLEADRIVERVYRELLGRAPDPSGREHWRRKIIEKDWSEEDFCDVIRKTDEYRQRQRSRPGAH